VNSAPRPTLALRARVLFRRLWSLRPFNTLATNATRAVLRSLGREIGRAGTYLPRSGKTTVRLPNESRLSLWSRGDDEVANTVFWHGWDGYEPEMSRLFYRLASSAQGVIDVGAYSGFYSALAGLANPGSRVFSLEPHPGAFARLERTLRMNGLANVRAFRLAAGARPDRAELFEPVSSALTTMSTLSPEFARHAERFQSRPHRYGVQSFEVRVQPLDDFVAEHDVGRVDLLKIDAEASEDDVLRGTRKTLRRDHPHIFCEVLNAEKGSAIQELLEPLGYSFLQLRADGPAPTEHVVTAEGKTDYLFTVDPAATRDPRSSS
jgi:FkbM family methyltransferase